MAVDEDPWLLVEAQAVQDQEPEPMPDAPLSLPAEAEPEEEPEEHEGDQQTARRNASGDDVDMRTSWLPESLPAFLRCRSPGSREEQPAALLFPCVRVAALVHWEGA